MHVYCSGAAICPERGRSAAGARKWVVNLRVLLLHNTQHDLPAVEPVLAAQGYVVRSLAVNALTLQAEVERWNPELILIAADDAARDVVEQICVNSQFRERPIVVFTEDDDPVAMRAAIQGLHVGLCGRWHAAKALLRRRGMREPDAYAALRCVRRRCGSAVRWLKWPSASLLVHRLNAQRLFASIWCAAVDGDG